MYNEGMLNWLQKQWKVLQLSFQIASLKRKLNKIYQELGKDYVDVHKNDPNDLNKEKIDSAVYLENQIKERVHTIDEIRGILRCVACNERIPNGSLFCPYCGLRQPDPEVSIVRYCPECGTKLEVDELYCHHCGAQIPQDNEETEQMVLSRPVHISETEKAVKVEEKTSE